ncbi:MAG: hypothetical protein KGL39_33745 [Patescibacteria group bacterium]|nr:hypothetical protein [Patescibacteria group bacterium]
MSAVADALNMRVRISSPRPAFCSGCHKGATEDVRFVDFQAAHDSGMVEEIRDGIVIRRMPGDDLHLCEACVRQAAEAIAFRPELHAQQSRRIAELERTVAHWRDYARRFEALVKDRPEPVTKRKGTTSVQ